MLNLSFEFQPIHQTPSQHEIPRSRVLRTFVEMEQDGSTEAAVSAIAIAFIYTVMRVTDPPANPDLSPLLKCVREAMETNGITRWPLPDYHREVNLDVVSKDGLRHFSFRALVERYSDQPVIEDVGDIADEELDDWVMDDEYDEEEEMSAVVEEEEDGEDDGESAVDLERCLKDVRVGIEVDCCGVCLEEMTAGSEAEAMGCGHIYHGGCIRKWLRQTKTDAACPLCRFPAAGQ